jgi:hypothetical protein
MTPSDPCAPEKENIAGWRFRESSAMSGNMSRNRPCVDAIRKGPCLASFTLHNLHQGKRHGGGKGAGSVRLGSRLMLCLAWSPCPPPPLAPVDTVAGAGFGHTAIRIHCQAVCRTNGLLCG